MGFKFESLNDLKPYTICVLLNGATFSYGKGIGSNFKNSKTGSEKQLKSIN